MKTMIYYIPILYMYVTRLKTVPKFLSWIFIYFFPIIYILFNQNTDWSFSIDKLFIALLSIISVYNFYEVGYIQNDAETIKKEQKPTQRLTAEQLCYYENNKYIIYSSRLLLGILFILLFYYIGIEIYGCIYFLISILFILLVYQIYNHVRSDWNILLYFLLSTLKYISPLSLFPEYTTWSSIIALIMVFPLEMTTEFKATKSTDVKTNIFFRKYIIKYDKNRITGYRVIAYAILSLIALALLHINFFTKEHTYIILCMFTYRLLIWFFVKIGVKFKGYLK